MPCRVWAGLARDSFSCRKVSCREHVALASIYLYEHGMYYENEQATKQEQRAGGAHQHKTSANNDEENDRVKTCVWRSCEG